MYGKVVYQQKFCIFQKKKTSQIDDTGFFPQIWLFYLSFSWSEYFRWGVYIALILIAYLHKEKLNLIFRSHNCCNHIFLQTFIVFRFLLFPFIVSLPWRYLVAPLSMYTRQAYTLYPAVYALYGCEIWSPKAEEEQKLEVLDRKCLRHGYNIRRSERISNHEFMKMYRQKPKISSIIKKRRLKWHDHVMRHP